MTVRDHSLYDSQKQAIFSDGYWTLRIAGISATAIAVKAYVIPPYCQPTEIEIRINGSSIRFERETTLNSLQATLSKRLQAAPVESVIFAKFGIPRDVGPGKIEVIDKYLNKPIGNPLYVDTKIFDGDEHVSAALIGRSNRANLSNFFLTGYDDSAKLVGLMESLLGTASAPWAVLDWGVGSGRVSRYLQTERRVTTYGCDIDPVNMSALHESGFDADRFRLMAPAGPIPFPDQSFDFCFGLSVFTHLTEELQDFYLAELVRVLKPGGAALFSLHGPMHFFSQINQTEMYAKLISEGIIVVSESHVLDEGFSEAKEKNLYVNTLHSYAYVLRHWSKFFKHVIISDALSITLHDYVLCRT